MRLLGTWVRSVGLFRVVGSVQPLSAQDHVSATQAAQAPFVTARGESRSDGTGDVRVKVSGAATGGAVAVLEVSTAMDAGAPLHMYHVENEWFYVLEGGAASDVPGCPPSFQEMAKRLKVTLPGSGCPSFFTAVQEQLGMRLEPQLGPLDVLVIDSVQPLTEN